MSSFGIIVRRLAAAAATTPIRTMSTITRQIIHTDAAPKAIGPYRYVAHIIIL
jgi:hypothetical protein